MAGEVELPAGSLFASSLNISRNNTEIYYNVLVLSGPVIDIYFLTAEDFERFRAGLPLQDPDSYGHNSTRRMPRTPYLNGGRYWFVLDNTDYGSTGPGGSAARVRYEVRV